MTEAETNRLKELAHAITKSVYDAAHTPIVLNIYGGAVDMLVAHDARIRAESAQEIAALKEEIKQLLLMMDTLGKIVEWTDEDGGPMVSWTGTSDSWFITHRHARALLKEEPK
jgi:hypothetical protein